ncbi:hypothetical protein MEO41_27680, partial [Dolichospermum sp. ST_sed4]|nr:hypothetical protein [Dolichospermum sp. ST_sed4]
MKIFVLMFLGFLLSGTAVYASTVRFVYDGDGVRVAKVENGKTTLYVGEMEKDLTSGQVTKYYSLAGKRIAVKDSEGVKYLITDHLGSIRNDGASYYPYGSIRTTGDLPSRQYTGQINDETTGLYFYNARYYNPQTGNFISSAIGSMANRYAYV